MPYLIVSDIHGNLEALTAVLADADGRYDSIICLGDLVGYGADPNAVVDWARANVKTIIRGNHDKACCGIDPLEHYNPHARASASWTRGILTSESFRFLENLPRGPLRYDNFDLIHGSPADEDEYLITVGDVDHIRSSIDSPLYLFGHTHVQGGFLVTRTTVKRITPGRIFDIELNHTCLLNPGAVGQPRDRDPRAAYAIFTPQERTFEYRRVAYDIDKAADKILAAGLPDSLAARLYQGL